MRTVVRVRVTEAKRPGQAGQPMSAAELARVEQHVQRAEEVRRPGRWRRAWTRMRAPWVALQALLCGTAVAFGVLWLELPDGSRGARVVAALGLLGGVALGAWAQAGLLLAMRRPVVRRQAWRGALWLLGLAGAYGLLAIGLDAGALQDGSRAAYLEERTLLWHVGGVAVLRALEAGVWWVLRWTLAAAMLPLLIESVAMGQKGVTWDGCTAPLRHGLYWTTVMGVAGAWTATEAGTTWFRPVVPVAVQAVLTVAKMGLLFAVGVGGLCFALSLTGTYLRDRERAQGARPRGRGLARRVRPETAGPVLSTR